MVEGTLDYGRQHDTGTWPSQAHPVTLVLMQVVVLAGMFELTEVEIVSTSLVDTSQFDNR